MKIGVIGAGNVGGEIGALLAAQGHEVMYGVRNPNSEKTQAALSRTSNAQALSPQEAADFAELIVLSTEASVAIQLAGDLTGLDGKIVVDATNRMRENKPISSTEEIAAAAPDAKVVKAFNNMGFNIYGSPDFNGTAATMFIAGDDTEAKQVVAGLCESLGFHVVDAGGLAYAFHLEKVAELWVNLAFRGGYGRDIAFRLMTR
jgi:predicted dinucleotide-binding enzyme